MGTPEVQNQQDILSPERQLHDAQQLADWFVPYIYGVDDIEVGKLPLMAAARIGEVVGSKPPVQQLAELRKVFGIVPELHRNNAILFLSGYPQSAIDVLGDGDIQETKRLLLNGGASYREVVDVPPPKRGISNGGVPPVHRKESTQSEQKPKVRNSVPDDWFTDPVRLGPLPERSIEPDDEKGPLDWQTDALCAQTDPEAFFPEKGGSTRDAKRICTACEVKARCLEYALANDERFGIWGGLSERERRRLRRRGSV